MAKQTGSFLSITIDNLIFYQWRNGWYVRTKGTITAKRIKKDPAFHAFRQNSDIMRRASKLASQVYDTVAQQQRSRQLYNRLTGEAIKQIREGMPEEKIITRLKKILPV